MHHRFSVIVFTDFVCCLPGPFLVPCNSSFHWLFGPCSLHSSFFRQYCAQSTPTQCFGNVAAIFDLNDDISVFQSLSHYAHTHFFQRTSQNKPRLTIHSTRIGDVIIVEFLLLCHCPCLAGAQLQIPSLKYAMKPYI